MKMHISNHSNYNSTLDILRALAALSVCFFHFDDNSFIGLSFVSNIFKQGHYGVDVFFVISGFVIPLSLEKMGFNFSDTGTFLYKRFLRLFPAFAASIVFVLIARYASGFTRASGTGPNIDFQNLLMNLSLTCDFFNARWIIPVFWSLSIEVQFYILLAISIPLLRHQSEIVRNTTLLLWTLFPLLGGSSSLVLRWTSLFALGITAFMMVGEYLTPVRFWLFGLVAFLVHWFTMGAGSAFVGALTVLAILYMPNVQSRFFVWVGTISYSLYLIHFPVGRRFVNLFSRYFTDTWYMKLLLIFGAAAASILVAYIFYQLIELPFHKYSKQITFKKIKNISTTDPI
jgi:peptidoglycan/LPS O-acetylase OafA/YrhL